MRPRRLPRILPNAATVLSLSLTAATSGGCHWCRDISASDPIRRSGSIGRRVTLADECRVVEVPHLRHRELVPAGDELSANDVPLGSLPAGTAITIVRVERCTYPPGITADLTVATISSGPLAGTEVVVNRAGLGVHPAGLGAAQ